MNNKSNAKLYMTIGTILILVVGFIAYKNVTKVQNYKENGKEVECVVTSVTQGRKGKQFVCFAAPAHSMSGRGWHVRL